MAGGQDIGYFQTEADCIDLKIVDGDLAPDNGLETAVLVSLWSDRYVQPEDLPNEAEDPRGWWADAISDPPEDRIGSRIWLFYRGKITTDAAVGIRSAILEALDWMREEGIAVTINVTTQVIANTRIDFDVQIFKPSGDDIPFKFAWDGQELKRTA